MDANDNSIRTARLELRRVTQVDAPRLAELVGDWDVVRTTAQIPHPYTVQDAEEFIARSSDRMTFAITRDGNFLGMIGCDTRSDDDLEIGYWIGRPYWGRGYVTECAEAVIDRAFQDDAVTRIHGGYFMDNPASGRVLAKLGFDHVGEATMNCVARDAEVRVFRLTLTRACWQARTAV